VPLPSRAQVRSGLGVPVELGGGPIGSLDLYATSPRAWDDTEVSALQAYAGVMASLLGAAAKAEVKGALMERERLDEQEAFTHLRGEALLGGGSGSVS
jgi:GAF domain-containing protein